VTAIVTTGHQEQAIQFACQGELLVGIVTQPLLTADQAPPSLGMVMVVGGPQYRAGSHRQFVLLARAMADAGIPTLRFDYRGMGDSAGDLRTFEDVNDDIAAAVRALQSALPSIKKITLWGLCDGASAALLYCHATHDARVSGLCLLNPWVRSEASLAKTQVKHYYTQRLGQKEFWVKLLSGKVAASALGELVRKLKSAFAGTSAKASTDNLLPYPTRMAHAWKQFQGHILLILSGDDFTAKEFLEYTKGNAEWAGALNMQQLTRHDLPGADHTFSNAKDRALVAKLTREWLA